MKNVKKLWHREQMKNEAKEKKEVGCRRNRAPLFSKNITVLSSFLPLQKSCRLFLTGAVVSLVIYNWPGYSYLINYFFKPGRRSLEKREEPGGS